MKITEQTEILIGFNASDFASELYYNNSNIKSLLYALDVIAIADNNEDILNLVCIAKGFSEKINELASSLEDIEINTRKKIEK